MSRMVKKLSKLDIDEVSLVDKPANQHGLVAIAKRDEENTMSAQPLFDTEGYQVDPSELEPNEYVYDEAGNEYINVVDEYDDQPGYDDEEDEVGKAVYGPLKRTDVVGRTSRAASEMSSDLRSNARSGLAAGRTRAGNAGRRAKRRATNSLTAAGMQYRALPANARTGIQYGGTLAAGGGAGYGAGRGRRDDKVGKSYGQSVLEELSKSYGDDDRDMIVSKAIDELAAENAILVSKAEQVEQAMLAMQAEQEYNEFVEVAKGYGYAGEEADEVAGLLYDTAANNPDQLGMLDRVLSSQSAIAKSLLSEQGFAGTYESDALAQVYALADEAVSKTDGQVSTEQAVTELFAANPGLYDEYESDNRY